MGIPLKQSTTSQEIFLGTFVDSTDGNTEETALTINSTDIFIWKQGATSMVNPAVGATHMNDGNYYFVADATDTNTLGSMVVFVHVSGALVVKQECEVYPSQVYDSLFSTDRLQVDVREKGDSTLALTTQEKADVNTEVDGALDTAVPGTPTSNSINERVKTMDDAYTATRAGYLDNISAGAVALASGVTVTTNNDKTGYALSAAAIDAIYDETLAGHTTADSTGLALKNLLKIGKNKWDITGTTFTIYDDDGTTPLYSFTLDSGTEPTSRTPA